MRGKAKTAKTTDTTKSGQVRALRENAADKAAKVAAVTPKGNKKKVAVRPEKKRSGRGR